MNNPNQFQWAGSNEREDGTPYPAEERRGYDVSIRPADQVDASPNDFVVFTAISQEYDFVMPISELGNPLSEGSYLATVRDVDTEGRASVWAPSFAFDIVVAAPKPPTGLAAS